MAGSMRAWQFSAVKGGVEKNLVLNQSAPRPPAKLLPDQLSVEVVSMSVNPVDYKLAELPLVGRFLLSKPSTPGIDYCGRVVATGSSVNALKPGQLVFGRLDKPMKFGTLGQFTIAPKAGATLLPAGVDADHGAAVPTCSLVAYQCIAPNVQKGDKVFINGGSGGTGVFGIQIAKALGCHVTASCSGANVQLCKDLGADEVIDYRTTNVSHALREKGPSFNLVFDTVGSPLDLYAASDTYMLGSGKYVQIGAVMTSAGVMNFLGRMLWPSILGGGKTKFQFLQAKNNAEDFAQISQWMQEGKVKAVIDSSFEYSQAPQAYEKLRTGRARGKIVIHVTDQS